MPVQITATAQMQCDKGAAASQMIVSSQHFYTAEDKYIATEADKQPTANIPSFGICALTQKPCLPALTVWQQTSPFTIEGLHELTTDSHCNCSVGGTIRFISSGHSNFIDIEE